MLTIGMFIVGLVLLAWGAEWLIRGASRLALSLGMTPMVVGLTVVALGTSSPELAVSIGAAATGQADLALGNVVGSNILNVLLILGTCALILPLAVKPQLLRFDLWFMLGSALLVWVFGADGRISRAEGAGMVVLLIAYLVHTIRAGRREQATAVASSSARPPDGAPQPVARPVRDVLLVIAGLVMLLLGAKWMVDGAVAFARAWGVSELVIGLTIVAAGTSLPEVATSIVATIRGERDLAVGNVVGSNIFNVLGVLGASAIFSAKGVAVGEAALAMDIPVMIAVSIVCIPVFFTGRRISRGEGLMFLGYYVAYTLYLVLSSRGTPELWRLRDGLLHIAIPATVIGLMATLAVDLLSPKRGGADDSAGPRRI